MKGLELSEKFYLEFGVPMLRENLHSLTFFARSLRLREKLSAPFLFPDMKRIHPHLCVCI